MWLEHWRVCFGASKDSHSSRKANLFDESRQLLSMVTRCSSFCRRSLQSTTRTRQKSVLDALRWFNGCWCSSHIGKLFSNLYLEIHLSILIWNLFFSLYIFAKNKSIMVAFSLILLIKRARMESFVCCTKQIQCQCWLKMLVFFF